MIKNKEDLKKYYKEQSSREIIELNEREIGNLVFDSLCLDYYLIEKLKENINDDSYTLLIKDIFEVNGFKEGLEKNLIYSKMGLRYDSTSNIIKNTLNYLYNIFINDGEYNTKVLLKCISDYLKNDRGIDSEILIDGLLINMNQFKED